MKVAQDVQELAAKIWEIAQTNDLYAVLEDFGNKRFEAGKVYAIQNPDCNCSTTSDGSCISVKPCMHSPDEVKDNLPVSEDGNTGSIPVQESTKHFGGPFEWREYDKNISR